MDFRVDWGVLVLLVVLYRWSFTSRSGETGLEKQAADHFMKILMAVQQGLKELGEG